MIIITNRRTGHNQKKAIDEMARTFYVGRGSALGNPFKVGPGQSRELAIAMYRPYIKQKISDNDEWVCSTFKKIVDTLKSGRTVALECYCAPTKCHAEVIAEIAQDMAEE
jgi:hypothetical protein